MIVEEDVPEINPLVLAGVFGSPTVYVALEAVGTGATYRIDWTCTDVVLATLGQPVASIATTLTNPVPPAFIEAVILLVVELPDIKLGSVHT